MLLRLRRQLQTGLKVLEQYGLRWTLGRLGYDVQRKLGILQRRSPSWQWPDRPLESWLTPGAALAPLEARLPGWFWQDEDHAALRQIVGDGAAQVIAEADAALGGQLRYFSGPPIRAGSPPRWHYDPVYGADWPRDRHWSRLESLPPDADVKLIWEPARFAVAFLWVRAYWLSGDEKYPAAFWAWFEDWCKHNPPMRGVHWLDGQECALRVLAWTFALFGFVRSPHSTPGRCAQLIMALAAHAERIAANHHYAVLQNQNHAISEAVGLYTVGALFPELRGAARWRTLGHEALSRAALAMIAEDGGFIQHSVNYQRLMLDAYSWALRLMALHGDSLPEEALRRLEVSAAMLYQLQDGYTGHLPNYGANDGARILPLAASDYRDYRPTLQVHHYRQQRERLYTDGPQDEMLFWLFGTGPFAAPHRAAPRTNLNAAASGYYTLRGTESWAFLRAHRYKTRPMQSDALHLDLWWRGLNIAQDAGTYSYNAPAPWRRGLAGAEVHNTLTLDRRDHMERGPRFLWFNWAQAEALFLDERTLTATRTDRDRPTLRHVRTVTLAEGEAWHVVDIIHYQGTHAARLHWLLADYPFQREDNDLVLQTPQGDYLLMIASAQGQVKLDVVRGSDARSARGWASPTYGVREPALSLAVEVVFTDHCELHSVFMPRAALE